MSELKKCGDHFRFDSMPTEELQEILRKHTNRELETDPDTDDLFAMMEVLSNRRQEENPQAFRSDEEAFAEFQQYYMPREEKEKAQTKVFPFLPRLPKAVASVLILTIGISVIMAALHFGFWGEFTSGGFMQSTDTPLTPNKTFAAEYAQLRKILKARNIDEKIAPAWLPDGYKHKDIAVIGASSDTSITTITAIYENGNTELRIQILQSGNISTDQIEINGSLLEAYTVDNTTYYISSQNETLQTVWISGGLKLQIIGEITIDEMKAMIDSI